MSKATNSSDRSKKELEPPIPNRPPAVNERVESVDSSAFYEEDEYDKYDDFGMANSGGGGGGSGTKNQKINRRQDNRGGGATSGTIYSTKHVRAKEALHDKGKKT